MSPRVFWHVVSLEARKRMSYRADFWINALVGLAVNLAIAYFIVLAIFRESGAGRIGGYSERGMLLYLVVVTLLGRIVRSTDMEHVIAQDIYEGGLTRYILYPTRYAVFKYAQQLGALTPVLVQVVVLALWIPFVLGLPEEVRITPASIAMGFAALVAANALHYLITLPIQGVAFWADNVWSLMVANRIMASLLGGMMVPLTLFPDWARRALAWTPFPYLFAFPADAFLGRLAPLEWARGMGLALAWCTIVWLVGRAVWRRGDLQYTGVGI